MKDISSLKNLPHYPVMLKEVLDTCNPKNGGLFVDCTYGAGGYSNAILSYPNTQVIALDRDPNIRRYAKKTKKKYENRFSFYNSKFSDLDKFVSKKLEVDCIIFDLGLSNFQLKNMKRGFSFESNSALDMTMGLNSFNANDLIKNVSEKDLKNILKLFGGEKSASKISKKIVQNRNNKNYLSGKDLSDLISSVKFKRNKTNPATKSFQAIRMIVNQELSEIYKTLNYIINNCKQGAVIIVITFHSLEDILVKKIFNFYGKKKSLSRYIPKKIEKDNISIRLLTNKVVKPSETEIKENPNSRSAKLRVIKKIKNPNIKINRKDLNMEKYFLLEEMYV